MSLWGKLAGGLVGGFAAGGPLGALLGVVAGHFLIDERIDSRTIDDLSEEGAKQPQRQAAFIIGVIALSAKMAKADGQVTAAEVEAFKQIVDIPPNEVKNVEWVFHQARQSVNGFDSYAKQLARLFQNEPQILEDLLDGLFHIARADDVLHEAELVFLEEVARIFGFKGAEYDRIKARHGAGAGDDPYKILGVTPDMTFDDIKKVYRGLVRENHPDAMIARGVPEEFVRVANDKLAAINSAYDKIEKSRNGKGA